MTEADWWSPFFAGLWSRIQAGGYPAERTAAECDLIQSALQLPEGANVLDIPCGIGRHSVELARRGFRVMGVDFNPEYVASAQQTAAVAKVQARFVVCDMRDFASPEGFDAAFCYFGSFGYFSDEENHRFLRAVAGNLRPGGRFLIEAHIAETLLPVYRERDWFWAGSPDTSVRVLEERHWNLETGRVDCTWTTIDGDVRSASTSIRIYAYRELRDLLRSAGFASVSILDRKTGQAFQLGSPRALVVAQIA